MHRTLRFLGLAAFLSGAVCVTHAQGTVNGLYTYPADILSPTSCLAQASDGNLYGGGATFNTTTNAEPTSFPVSSCNWLQGTDNNFYVWSGDTVNKVSPSGASTPLVNLGSSSYTINSVIQDSGGAFYAATQANGTYNCGTLSQFNSSGTVTVLYDFTCGPDGSDPVALLQGADGNLYGSTEGTVFRYTSGSLTTLANTGFQFLVQGSGGTLYGIEYYDGGGNFASVALDGTVTNLVTPASLGVTNFNGPCFAGGDTNIYCSAATEIDDSTYYNEVLQFTPSGDATTYISFNSNPSGGGTSSAQYALAGNGSYYGLFALVADNNDDPYETFEVYNATGATATPPIQIALSQAQVVPGESTALTWQLNNGFSDNMKECFASGAWSGVQSPSGSLTAPAPATPGTYRYALTCGGVETNAVTLYDAVPQVTLAVSPSELAVGVPVTLTATVTGNNGTAGGTVNIMNGTTVEVSLPLNGKGVASATVPTTGLPAGTYDLTAKYLGTKSYASAQSAAVAVHLLASKYPCQAVYLSISPTTVSPGETITLTADATYASGSLAQSGTVTFNSGTLVLGTASIPSGAYVATLKLAVPQIPGGNYPVTATYNGNPYIGSCTSGPTLVTVNGTPTSKLTLTASPTTVTPPATVTLTATQATASGKPAPTGTVQFYNGSTYLGASSLNGSGVATFALSTSGDSAGAITITANYLGDSNYAKDSAMANITVE